MTGNPSPEKYARLVRLIRRIAREEAWQIIDEHLEDYVHRERPTEESEEE